MDMTVHMKDGWFNMRTAGLVIRDGKLLVMKLDSIPFYLVPGGRIAWNEASDISLKREFEEELSAEIEIERLLWVVESFGKITTTQEPYHQITFYYLVSLLESPKLLDHDSFTCEDEKGSKLYFLWQPIEKLDQISLIPGFLPKKILHLPKQTEHLIDHTG